MSEPWTPGPWHEERGMLLSDDGYIVCDPYGPNPQDRTLIAAAPEMAALLTDARPIFISDWFARRDALLSRIRGEAP